MKLWEKDNSTFSNLIDKFTVGKDNQFDAMLARYDVEGSIAHVTMLGKVGLMTKEESGNAITELERIQKEIGNNQFKLPEEAEDIHSYIEELLTQRIGETGKKIHSGRSRNDQVALDIKLFLRHEITLLKGSTKDLFDILIALSEKHKSQLIPGFTHFQVAMPSSFGLWFGAYAESLIDDLETLASAYCIVNKNPLGSGAGYGSSFPLDRELTTHLMQFPVMNYNSIYAQMTRGKSEKIVAMALTNIAATLSKFSMDCCLYLSQNFGFISFPDEFTTGSSIMPHKKNPDVFELIRARCNRIQSIPNEITLLIVNLPSGYHRDLQLTKEILFPAFRILQDCISLTLLMLKEIKVKNNVLSEKKYKYCFSVEAVNELVNNGVSFREAYRLIGKKIEEGNFNFDPNSELHHTHSGSLGNLRNDKIIEQMNEVLKKFDRKDVQA